MEKMKSIFELENRLDINNEFEKLLQAFQGEGYAVKYKNQYNLREYGSFMDGINNTVFLEWQYRDTFLNVYDYLDFIGIDEIFLENEDYNDENKFLLYLEFILNMAKLLCYSDKIELMPITAAAIENVPRILEKMNYKMEELEDKVIITKRDANADSILEKVPEDITKLLLEYNDFRISKDIKEKKRILKSLDLYMDKDNKFIKKNINNELKNCIETIVNNMGINHETEKEPFNTMTDKEKIEWYDKCYLMIIHAIRSIEIKKIMEERKKLI
ncbi:MAG: hypothetical protein HFJ29_00680 [Clostridia bacterium]|nr:hypothetical protein [Clostridia bacterium]